MDSELNCGFSHNYPKLHGQTMARLVDAVVIDFADIDEDALDYDTEYFDSRGFKFHFPLKTGEYIRLTFIGDKGIPFTTYRKFKMENIIKYIGNLGKWFGISVKDD